MSELTTTPRFAVGEISPEIERTNQYTIAALARHKQEGLELAVRARWVALLVVAVLLPFLNFQIDILFTYFLLALIALNGWVLRRVGRVGHSQSELGFIFLDVVLITYSLIGPNPLRVDSLPTAFVFQFGTFSYIFIILVLGGLSYSWRTILALGTWPLVFRLLAYWKWVDLVVWNHSSGDVSCCANSVVRQPNIGVISGPKFGAFRQAHTGSRRAFDLCLYACPIGAAVRGAGTGQRWLGTRTVQPIALFFAHNGRGTFQQ